MGWVGSNDSKQLEKKTKGCVVGTDTRPHVTSPAVSSAVSCSAQWLHQGWLGVTGHLLINDYYDTVTLVMAFFFFVSLSPNTCVCFVCSVRLWLGSEWLLHEECRLPLPAGLPEASRHALQQLQGICGGGGGDGPGEDLPSRLLCVHFLQVSLSHANMFKSGVFFLQVGGYTCVSFCVSQTGLPCWGVCHLQWKRLPLSALYPTPVSNSQQPQLSQ